MDITRKTDLTYFHIARPLVNPLLQFRCHELHSAMDYIRCFTVDCSFCFLLMWFVL